MKKIILSILILSTFVTICFAKDKKHTISTNMLGLILGSVNATYETPLKKENTSLSITGAVQSLKSGDWKWTNLGAGVAYNMYTKERFRGFYHGPAATINSISAKYSDESASSMFFSIGYNAANRWVYKNNTFLNFGIGMGYTMGSLSIGKNDIPYGGFGITKFSFDFGFLF